MIDIPKGNDIIRVSKTAFKGKEYLGIRIYYAAPNGDWMPTKKGIGVSVDMTETLLNAIKEVQKGEVEDESKNN